MPRGSNELFRDVWQQLYLRGHKPWKIDDVLSAGESLTGDTTVFFINSAREAMTGYISSQLMPKKKASDPEEYRLHIVVIPGWHVEVPA